MRSIDSAALAKLATQLGTEPVTIVEIQWVDGGQRYQYADKDIDSANIKGKIIALGSLDNDVQITYNAQSSQLDMTLDDIDGAIKQIVDNNDIHLRPCWIYQWFQGLDINDRFLLFKGEINTPITWKEGDRTISFTVISQIEDIDIGFSIEQGNFFIPDPSMVGKAWPLCFGTVTNVPAFKLVPPVSGILATGTGIVDFTLDPRIQLAQNIPCPMVSGGEQVVYSTGPVGIGYNDIEQVWIPDPDCVKQTCNQIAQWQNQLSAQEQFQSHQITIFGGERFPQGVPLTLNINGGLFGGTMNGELFTITSRTHPNLVVKPDVQIPLDVPLQYATCENRYKQLISEEVQVSPLNSNPGFGISSIFNWRGTYDPAATYQPFDAVTLSVDGITQSYVCTQATVGHSPFDSSFWNQLPLAVGSRFDYAQSVLNALPQAGFFWANAGATVTIHDGEPLVYIANILPSTILRVAAYRQLDVGPVLVTVPPEFYSIQLVDYVGYQMMQITVPFPLSSYGSGWTDDLYITLTSSVGPNTVDIITWLVDTYSAHGIDSTSFNHVKPLVDNYPMHFALLERQPLIDTLQQIAYQARCSLQLKDDTFYLTYLPETPTPVDTITESDVIYQTLELYHTNTEDLVTDYTVTYQDDYAAQPYTLIYRHNVKKYMTRKAQDNYYTFNILDLVRKAATFWLIRRSNTWRMVRLSTPLTKLNLEVGDPVTLNLPEIAPSPVTGLVYKAAYNSDAHTIDFEFWTPLRSGETTPYVFAFPKDVDEKLIFPTPDEREKGFGGGGPGPNFITAPPLPQLGGGGNQQGNQVQMGAMDCNGQFVRISRLGNVLDSSDFNDGQCHNDFGQQKPSDQGDSKPSPTASEDDSDAQGSSNPLGPGSGLGNNCCQQAYDLAQQAMNQANKAIQQSTNQQSGGGGGGDGSDPNDLTGKVPNCKTAQQNNSCTFTILVTYSTPSKVFSADKGFMTKDGDSGTTLVQSSSTRTSATSFGSESAANDFLTQIQSQINALLVDGPYVVGQEAMTAVARQFTPGASDSGKTDCGANASKQVIGYCKSV